MTQLDEVYGNDSLDVALAQARIAVEKATKEVKGPITPLQLKKFLMLVDIVSRVLLEQSKIVNTEDSGHSHEVPVPKSVFPKERKPAAKKPRVKVLGRRKTLIKRNPESE